MNKYANTKHDIHVRIHNFVVNCFMEIVRKIPKSPETNPIISQILASLTSIGANDNEADCASTKRDFIAKYSIVKKEARETRYWLKLLSEAKIVNNGGVEYYIGECQEILMIVSKIINNTKYNNP